MPNDDNHSDGDVGSSSDSNPSSATSSFDDTTDDVSLSPTSLTSPSPVLLDVAVLVADDVADSEVDDKDAEVEEEDMVERMEELVC